MKILLFLLTFIIIGKFARSQDTIHTKLDSSKLNWNNVYSDAKDALKGLGSALKVGSEHVYETLVKQQIVDSIIWLIILVIFIIGCYFDVKIVKYIMKNGNGLDEAYGILVIAVVFTLLLLIVFLYVLSNIPTIVTGFVNPEYGAIKEILDMIKNK